MGIFEFGETIIRQKRKTLYPYSILFMAEFEKRKKMPRANINYIDGGGKLTS